MLLCAVAEHRATKQKQIIISVISFSWFNLCVTIVFFAAPNSWFSAFISDRSCRFLPALWCALLVAEH